MPIGQENFRDVPHFSDAHILPYKIEKKKKKKKQIYMSVE